MTHPKQSQIVGLDFETYSAAPLPSVGLANYVNDPTFQPTLAAVATGAGTDIFRLVYQKELEEFRNMITDPGLLIVAHNAGFERAVLRHMGLDLEVRDSAVAAAVAGANRHLRGAADQLLNLGKLDEDGKLIRLFAIPQEDQDSLHFDESLIAKHRNEWTQFEEYCMRDAELSRKLWLEWWGTTPAHLREQQYAQVTLDMNETGWPVDVKAAQKMLELYRANIDALLTEFADEVDAELNLFSTPQLKEWCAKRGIKSESFDKEHVDKLIARLEKKYTSLTPDQKQVLRMLLVKRELGGSSLKKLETILDTQCNGRVYDQYVHAGAAQSLRTSGRSIQMQNLPRLNHMRDLADLYDPTSQWTNEDLSENLRQLFRATEPSGQLIVADYAAIESRALAFMAGEDWKVEAYRNGDDVYKRQAMKIYNLQSYQAVTDDERRTGKVGELSCGYGAGPVAVKDFAEKMGVKMGEAEAKQLVYDWRDANPATTKMWSVLDEGLHTAVEKRTTSRHLLAHNLVVTFQQVFTPSSLLAINPDAVSIEMVLTHGKTRYEILRRVFHGCYVHGTNIGYYKPSSLKTGKPWKRTFTNPKTKREQRYELYGGKLTGILTQSLCRELFFADLLRLKHAFSNADNVKLIGQFHDEVIVEWKPGTTASSLTHAATVALLETQMSTSQILPDLPMAVDVKTARRYIK